MRNQIRVCILNTAYQPFPGGSDGKASARNAGDWGSIPGLGRSVGEGNGTPVLLPRKFRGLRSLVGYSPWGHEESDMTEQLHHDDSIVRVLVSSLYFCLC